MHSKVKSGNDERGAVFLKRAPLLIATLLIAVLLGGCFTYRLPRPSGANVVVESVTRKTGEKGDYIEVVLRNHGKVDARIITVQFIAYDEHGTEIGRVIGPLETGSPFGPGDLDIWCGLSGKCYFWLKAGAIAVAKVGERWPDDEIAATATIEVVLVWGNFEGEGTMYPIPYARSK